MRSRAIHGARQASLNKDPLLEEELLDISPELLLDSDTIPDELSLEPDILPDLKEIISEDKLFNRNIVDDISEQVRGKIANYLKGVTEEDIKARQGWLDIIEKVKPFLGFEVENLTAEDDADGSEDTANNQIRTFDTTLSTALLRLWALLRSELLPSNGPVGFKTNIDNREDFELKGEMIRDSLNEYLTIEDKGFYPDYDRFLLYLLLYGCVFRKVYDNSLTKKPISRFIIPEDFLVDNNCSGISESNRLTHIRKLSKREIILNIQDGIFSDYDISYLDNNTNTDDSNSENSQEGNYSNNSRYLFYETHEYLDLNEFLNDNESLKLDFELSSLPSPYIITRCNTTNEIVSIIPNWLEDDSSRERINYFVHYNLFPGFDIYGLGLAQILGSNAVSLTKIQRMAIDAAIFQNFPGGMKAPGVKVQDNDITITPGQWVTVDTGSIPLNQAIMPLPYNGPSPALLELSQRLIAQTQQLASTSEIGLPENSQNTPVGTTMAMLEVANRMQSAILRTVHASFSNEIQLLYKMLNPVIEEDVIGKVIPISDPSVESTTQRIMKAESLLKIASADPSIHNMSVIYRRIYESLGISNIDEILKSPEQISEANVQQPMPIDPAQVEMADIQQRILEVESRERIAHLNIEADGYKTQMNIELDKAKMEQDRYLAELKVAQEQEDNQVKKDIELLKLELKDKETNMQLMQKQAKDEADHAIESLKIEAKEHEIELKSQIEILKEQLKLEKGARDYEQEM